MSDADVQGYMNAIGKRIITAAAAYDAAGEGPSSHKKSDTKWMFTDQMQFHLVNSKTVNAFTTGGQHLYVYSALLNLCDNEDDLAAVMSHEFAHVYCRHVQQGTNRQTRMTVLGYTAEGAGYLYGGSANGAQYADTAGKGATAITQFAGLSFTRGDESEADAWGFKFYARAGWDTGQFGHFFQKMVDAGYDTTPAIKSDHPTLKSRVEAAKKQQADWLKQHPNAAALIQPPIKDPAAFIAFRNRAAQIAATTPNDSQTQKAQQLLSSFSSCMLPTDPPGHEK
jgi:predicted Zn-dependent protease